MPKFTFTCDACGFDEQKIVPVSTNSVPCTNCQSSTRRLMPRLNGAARVNEIVDKYTGTIHLENQAEQVKLRTAEYYWTVEVPRFVQSGTYSVLTMLENDWITVDEKGQMHINNVPPHRR